MPANTQRRTAQSNEPDYEPILRHLTIAYAATITAELALKQQNTDRDSEIAETLRVGVVWSISEAVIAIEKLAGIRPE